MPRYDYRCMCCGSIVERTAGYEDTMITQYCATCASAGAGGSQLFHRTIASNPPAIIFKGHGWEKDNYNGKSNREKTDKTKGKTE